MSPARKRSTKGAKKTTKKATRKTPTKKASKAGARKKARKASAKTAAARKTTRKLAKKTVKRDAQKKSAAEPSAPAPSSKPSKGSLKKRPDASAARSPKPARKSPKPARKSAKLGFAQPLESAEKKPGLGAKWACFSCGAKFYDLNRPDPICPKCHTDQREQPAKSAVAVSPPPVKRPAAAPITRLLDDEEGPDAVFDDNGDAESAAELDIGKFEDEDALLDDAEFGEDSDD